MNISDLLMEPSVNAIFTASLSLLSAYLVARHSGRNVREQIRSENERLEKKLKHESEESALERATDMRREAFMVACEGLTLGSQYLSKFADTELSPEKHLEMIAQIAPRLHRIHIIAGDATLRALIDAYEFFLEQMLELQKKRLKLNFLQAHLRGVSSQIEESKKFEQLLLIELAKLAGPTTLEAQRQLERRCSSIRDTIAALEQNRMQVHLQLFESSAQLGCIALRTALDFENLASKAVLAMREELNLKLVDAAGYESRLHAVREKAKRLSDAAISEILDTTKREVSKITPVP